MKILYRCCAGLDVHRDTISACVRRRVKGQSEPIVKEQVFGTFTTRVGAFAYLAAEEQSAAGGNGFRSCRLNAANAPLAAMESTGVYWIPVWNVLEASKQLHLMLVNPATVRALQGHKTDRIDARRIAEYLQYGLLRGSFIPPKPIRELRELTRMRVHIQQDRNRVINRMAQLLETVKLAGFGGEQHCGRQWTSDAAAVGQRGGGAGASGRMRTRPVASEEVGAGTGFGGPAGCAFPLDVVGAAAQVGRAG